MTANQSKVAVFPGFLAVRCANCVPDLESNPPTKMPFGFLVRTLPCHRLPAHKSIRRPLLRA